MDSSLGVQEMASGKCDTPSLSLHCRQGTPTWKEGWAGAVAWEAGTAAEGEQSSCQAVSALCEHKEMLSKALHQGAHLKPANLHVFQYSRTPS